MSRRDDQAHAQALLEDVIDVAEELLEEMRRLRKGGLVARLSDGERDEIARRVFERIDEQHLPPPEQHDDAAPRRRGR